jgi:hypothetical protein
VARAEDSRSRAKRRCAKSIYDQHSDGLAEGASRIHPRTPDVVSCVRDLKTRRPAACVMVGCSMVNHVIIYYISPVPLVSEDPPTLLMLDTIVHRAAAGAD